MLGSLIYMMIMLILMTMLMMPAITEGVVSSRSRGRELAPVCRARQAHPKHTLHSKKHKYTDTQTHKYTDTQIHKHKYWLLGLRHRTRPAAKNGTFECQILI